MHNWPGRNSLLHILFLFIVFISIIKRESETNTCFNSVQFSSQTYTSFVVAGKQEPDQLIQRHDPFTKGAYPNQLFSHPRGVPDCLTLKFAIHDYNDIIYNTSHQYSPLNYILNILHRQNIWHQSSENGSSVPLIC